LNRQNPIVYQGDNPILHSMSIMGIRHVTPMPDITSYNEALTAL